MSILHTWNVFKRARTVLYVLIGALDFGLAILVLVKLIHGWPDYDVINKITALIVFFINLFSTLCLVLMLFTRIRPLADFARVVTILVFQIGSVVAFTLVVPYTCRDKPVSDPCRVQQTAILYGSCASCAFLCIYILFLVPVLRLPQNHFNPPPVNPEAKLSSSFSDTASTLTYHSWDRNPEKGLKRTSIDTHYSQRTYVPSYYFTLPGHRVPAPAAQPLHIAKKPAAVKRPEDPFRTPETLVVDLSTRNGDLDGASYLRPFTPMPAEPTTNTKAARGSVASVESRGSSIYAASWLMEPPRAVLSSTDDKQPLRSSQPNHNQAVAIPPKALSDTQKLQYTKPLAVPSRQNRHRPHMLSLDTSHISESMTLSDVPRTPSPIGTHSPHSPFPVTPNSGMLPKHPRLTTHMRGVSTNQMLSPPTTGRTL